MSDQPNERVTHSVEIKLQPLRVPRFILCATEGITKVPISSLTPEALAALCDQFRRNAFTEAGKKDPAR